MAGLLSLALLADVRGDGEAAGVASQDAYETDRPGEVENPFTVAPGQPELVSYLLGMNAAARGDDFGGSGSATFLDTAVRFGVTDRFEGMVAVDTFLAGNPALGYATLLAKWNFLKSADGDFGVSLAPYVRVPLDRATNGPSQGACGLIVPFGVDLEGGWELEGSTSFSRPADGAEERDGQWENQVSVERVLTPRLSSYVELEVESGDGPPVWATEFGFTAGLGSRVMLDVGYSLSLGANSRQRTGYAGVGWRP